MYSVEQKADLRSSNGVSKQLYLPPFDFSCFVSVKAVGEGSGNSESASGINLPSFTYEINK